MLIIDIINIRPLSTFLLWFISGNTQQAQQCAIWQKITYFRSVFVKSCEPTPPVLATA